MDLIRLSKVVVLLSIGLIFSCSTKYNFVSQKTDLIDKWDTIRPLANPDKGWYHHMLDNGIGKYLLQEDEVLDSFPGMDHLYLRLAWSFLEPEEGIFDWSHIDDIVEKYVPMGYNISFRISCKETGPAPTSVPYEVDGIRYATPYWVKEAGAKGVDRPEYGSASWTPDWDDPVYLEKLHLFHKAFAEKYDGKSWVRYIDVGSIGDWGEGHTWSSTRIPPTVEEIKTHMDLYLEHYKNTQLVVTDDILAYEKSNEESLELLDYAIDNGFTLRDDSPLVQGYMLGELDTWTVRSPHFFEAIYKTLPTVFELEHYGKVKENGYWLGKNGEDTIPEFNLSGAKVFREAMKLIHPTYIGYHGYMEEWLEDNPGLTVELLNLCGYWYFPNSINSTQYRNGELKFEIEWLNKGLAPAYSSYQLRGKLIPADNSSEIIAFEIENSGNKNWMPDQLHLEKYVVALSKEPIGNYQFAIQLFDENSGTPVDIGLSTEMQVGDYFVIQSLSFNK